MAASRSSRVGRPVPTFKAAWLRTFLRNVTEIVEIERVGPKAVGDGLVRFDLAVSNDATPVLRATQGNEWMLCEVVDRTVSPAEAADAWRPVEQHPVVERVRDRTTALSTVDVEAVVAGGGVHTVTVRFKGGAHNVRVVCLGNSTDACADVVFDSSRCTWACDNAHGSIEHEVRRVGAQRAARIAESVERRLVELADRTWPQNPTQIDEVDTTDTDDGVSPGASEASDTHHEAPTAPRQSPRERQAARKQERAARALLDPIARGDHTMVAVACAKVEPAPCSDEITATARWVLQRWDMTITDSAKFATAVVERRAERAAQWQRFSVWLDTSCTDEDLEQLAEVAELSPVTIQRAVDVVRVGPPWAGAYPGPCDGDSEAGFLGVLAKRAAIDELDGYWDLAIDTLAARFGTRVGPLAWSHAEGGAALTHDPRRSWILFVGNAGSGKTSALDLISATQPGPRVMLSTKADTWDYDLASVLVRQGPVYLIDPTGRMPLPHEEVRRFGIDLLDTVVDFVSAKDLTARVSDFANREIEGRLDVFWPKSAECLIAPLLFAARSAGLPFDTIGRWLNSDGIQEEVMSAIARSTLPGAEDAALMFRAVTRNADVTLQSIMQTARTMLMAFVHPAAASLLSNRRPGSTPDELVASNATVLIYADQKASLGVEKPITLLIDMILDARVRATDRGEGGAPLWVSLDETANATTFPADRLGRFIGELPGRGVTGAIVLQDFAQAEARWGQSTARVILSGAGTRVFYPGQTHPAVTQLIVASAEPGSEEFSATHPGADDVIVIDPLARRERARMSISWKDPHLLQAQEEATLLRDARLTGVVEPPAPPTGGDVRSARDPNNDGGGGAIGRRDLATGDGGRGRPPRRPGIGDLRRPAAYPPEIRDPANNSSLHDDPYDDDGYIHFDDEYFGEEPF